MTSEITIRRATLTDLPRLTDIYNYYVLNTPVTFDCAPRTPEQRTRWFEQFASTGRYRLLVAEQAASIVGYAGTTRFRPKAGYDPTVEMTIYIAPEAVGMGLGSKLYSALFEDVRGEDIHRFMAGYALPNPATEALHRKFGFTVAGIFKENGRKFGKYWDVCWAERPGK
jgi:phosphinothricin acetyltransferase